MKRNIGFFIVFGAFFSSLGMDNSSSSPFMEQDPKETMRQELLCFQKDLTIVELEVFLNASSFSELMAYCGLNEGDFGHKRYEEFKDLFNDAK